MPGSAFGVSPCRVCVGPWRTGSCSPWPDRWASSGPYGWSRATCLVPHRPCRCWRPSATTILTSKGRTPSASSWSRWRSCASSWSRSCGRNSGHRSEIVGIQALNISKRFGDFVALDDVSVDVRTGQLTALLGPSGGGKSTLLRIIAGLDQADAGPVSIEGTEATKLPPQKRNVGFVFQHYAVFKHMTVAKNVAFGLEIRKRPKDEVAHRVDELLRLVHLQQFSHRLPSQLSGGQRQRMALARALAVEPKVLLLDEPFGALDAKVRKELREWLRRLHDDVHVTTVFVTHDQEEALEVADEIVVINA